MEESGFGEEVNLLVIIMNWFNFINYTNNTNCVMIKRGQDCPDLCGKY